MVRQRFAKPSFPGSNPGAASKVEFAMSKEQSDVANRKDPLSRKSGTIVEFAMSKEQSDATNRKDPLSRFCGTIVEFAMSKCSGAEDPLSPLTLTCVGRVEPIKFTFAQMSLFQAT